jgi:hypothetical protein
MVRRLRRVFQFLHTQLALKSLHSLKDADGSRFKVHVLPAEPQRFTWSESSRKRHSKERLQSFSFQRLKQLARLLWIQGCHLTVWHTRRIDERGDIARNYAPLDSLIKRIPESGVHMTHSARVNDTLIPAIRCCKSRPLR